MYATAIPTNPRTHTKRSTERTLPQVKRVFQSSPTLQRPLTDTSRTATSSPENSFANGFLKTTFPPKVYHSSKHIIFSGEEQAQLKTTLKCSLAQMADHYGFTPFPIEQYDLSCGIALALSYSQEQIKKRDTKGTFCELKVLKAPNSDAFFSCEERFYLPNEVFFVPLQPLYRLLKVHKNKPLYELFLSVYAYLNQRAFIANYVQEDCFVAYAYEMLQDCISQDYEEIAERDHLLHFLKQAQQIGAILSKKIRNPCHLDFFQRRIDRFIPKNDLEAECLALSQAFYTLWQDFPNHSIYTHLHRAEGYEQGEEELFEVEKYLSFVYEDQSDLFHTYLLDWLNGEYSQCSEIELPTIYKHFNSTTPLANFDFEQRFFPLLTKLITLLNRI